MRSTVQGIRTFVNIDVHNYIQCINSLDTIIEGKNIDDYMGLLRDYPEVTTSTTTLRSKTTGVSIDM